MSGKDKEGVVHTIWELTVLSKFHFVIAVDYRRVYIYIYIYIYMYIICCRHKHGISDVDCTQESCL